MVDRSHPRLSVGEQCRLLSLPRSTFYYTPQGETPLNLTLMRRIDEQFLETPFYGVRQMTWHLRAEGTPVNEKRIRRLMRLMGLMPIYQRPKTSIRAKEHRIWPYLLRSLRIDRANHVWCADVTYSAPRPGWSGVHMTGML
jgi:putative transposase